MPELEPRITCSKLDDASQPIEGIAFALLARGDLVLRFDDGDCVRLGVGDLLFLPAGVRCELDARRRSAEAILVEIPCGWAARANALAGPGSEFAVDRAVFAHEQSGAAQRAGRLLRMLGGHSEPGDARWALRVTAAVVELLALAPEFDANAPAPTAHRATRREKFLAAVDAARSEPLDSLSLASLAARLRVSERQISRWFAEHLEQGFRGWATDLRLDRARQLLRDTERPIIDVAAETGWRSLSHFNARFKTCTGFTPGEYRSQCHRTSFTTSE